MKINRATLEDCHLAEDTVVVIDVLRAVTTACYAFLAGASEIFLTSTVEEAFELQRRFPGSLITGEVKGRTVPGFDFGNSPSFLSRARLDGVRLIQRTSAGTQGAARSVRARRLLAACLCNATATALALLAQPDESITLVSTGVRDGGWGEEDLVCADSLELLLAGGKPDWGAISTQVRGSRTGLLFTDPESEVFPAADLDLALAIDSFPAHLEIERQGDLFVLRPGRDLI
jgi:2-phosphosulfolactate phosphatase